MREKNPFLLILFKESKIILSGKRPLHQYSWFRKERQQFDKDEYLHFRLKLSDLDSNNKPKLESIKPPGQSVNRSWRGRAEDCLFPTVIGEPIDKYKNWGIGRFKADEIIKNFIVSVPITKNEFKVTSWKVRPTHDPEPNLYSHCEIRVSESDKPYDPEVKLNGTTKLNFRRDLMLAFDKVLKQPVE